MKTLRRGSFRIDHGHEGTKGLNMALSSRDLASRARASWEPQKEEGIVWERELMREASDTNLEVSACPKVTT